MFEVLLQGYSQRMVKTNKKIASLWQSIFGKYDPNVITTSQFQNPFPPSFLLSLQSISTGAMNHKITDYSTIANGRIYDYGQKMFELNSDILPIFTRDNMNEGSSLCVNWAGCEFNYGNVSIDNLDVANLTIMQQTEKIIEALDSR